MHDTKSSNFVDFEINDIQFEIGGKQKKQKQIVNLPKSYIVKDDIENGYLNVIPLWYFGLLY